MISLKPRKIILIGASTGGPGLIESIVRSLDEPLDATIIMAQHMQRIHLDSFAKRLNRLNSISVKLVERREVLAKGSLYLLAESAQLYEENTNLILQETDAMSSYYHPSIDELFFSAAKLLNVRISAYLLSGIGADGAEGLLALKKNSAKTIAQDKETSIVYGMPKVAYEINAAQHVLGIEAIIASIQQAVK